MCISLYLCAAYVWALRTMLRSSRLFPHPAKLSFPKSNMFMPGSTVKLPWCRQNKSNRNSQFSYIGTPSSVFIAKSLTSGNYSNHSLVPTPPPPQPLSQPGTPEAQILNAKAPLPGRVGHLYHPFCLSSGSVWRASSRRPVNIYVLLLWVLGCVLVLAWLRFWRV